MASMNASDSPLIALCEVLNRECQAGIEPLADGSLALRMADDTPVAVSLSPDGADIVFHSALAVLDSPQDVTLMMAALACNLHQEHTCGGAIGLDLASQVLVYALRIPGRDVDSLELLSLMDRFCDAAALLRQRLDEASTEVRPQTGAAAGLRLYP